MRLSQHVHAGDVMEIPKAVCLHEEDAGVLWKHMDYRTGRHVLDVCVVPSMHTCLLLQHMVLLPFFCTL